MTSKRAIFGRSRIAEAVVVTLSALTFTVALTYPLTMQIGTHLAELGDSKFSTYVHTWVAHALSTRPSELWNMNFFYPMKGTLACSENWLGDQWLFLPVYLLTKDPVAAHNFVILSSFFLSAITMYIFLRWVIGSPWPAAIGGFIYGFSFPRLSAIDHMHLLNLMWAPFIVLFLYSFCKSRRLRDLLALCVFIVLQVLCSLYLGYLGLLIAGSYFVGLAMARPSWITWRVVRGLLAGAVICAILLLPVVLPYLSFQKQGVIVSDPVEVARASADPIATYLDVWGWPNHIYYALLRRFNSTSYGWEKRFFFGFLPMLLAIVGAASLFTARRSRVVAQSVAALIGIDEKRQDRVKLLEATIYGSLITVISAYVLSLGPYLRVHSRVTQIRLPFFYISRVVPGLVAFRAPVRFAFAVLFGVAVLAAVGFGYLLQRLEWRPSHQRAVLSAALTSVALLFMYFEFNVAPFHLLPVMVPPAIAPEYQWLAKQPAGSAVVELPITGGPVVPDVYQQAAYVYASMYHWQPILNGYTSHPPTQAVQTYGLALELPAADAASVLRTLGFRYVVLHTDTAPVTELQQWTAPHPGLTEVQKFANATIYGLDGPLCASDPGGS